MEEGNSGAARTSIDRNPCDSVYNPRPVIHSVLQCFRSVILPVVPVPRGPCLKGGLFPMLEPDPSPGLVPGGPSFRSSSHVAFQTLVSSQGGPFVHGPWDRSFQRGSFDRERDTVRSGSKPVRGSSFPFVPGANFHGPRTVHP